ncbi:hypothetical protein FA04_13805 [Ensifer adhaerens]|uniref:Uncharacterized protein n=1 Tax=Ensifer adhaerens TaxID=106592 RepID=A0ABY8HC55_ENSAD|nr:hypothetical protein [Ensifer adhaerens]ANK73598.1 hypothetical protein FA04_13805 [Ensifer adhaerens]KDP73624.1 hypothetical protein FA04_11005 [Ensifer adhaerens]WFP89674.1 hypothetical protein P4B07_14030 [Ensifer adhaerens]
MPFQPEIANLPLATVLFLAAGYSAYFIANTGIRDHHKSVDVAFSSAVFGFFGLFFHQWLVARGTNIAVSTLLPYVATCVIGILWRLIGRSLLKLLLRGMHVSYADELPSAWVSMFNVTGFDGTQLAVQLKNGTWLECDDLHRFTRAPNGPCVLGTNGDVLMYVTHFRPVGEDRRENAAVQFGAWGDEITFIPSSEIARIDFRRRKITSPAA